ncbi:MAG: protein-export chaperone SecB [Rickettsiales bacterium]
MKTNTLEKPESQLPSIAINGHYIKELTFDNKNSPASFVPQNSAPKIEIAINFNNRSLQDNLYEVFLIVKAQANSMDEVNMSLFDVKLSYAGLFTINNIEDAEQLDAILMINCTSLLFPYARRVLSDVTRDGGFQPIMLEHMDFGALHSQRKLQKEATESASINVN